MSVKTKWDLIRRAKKMRTHSRYPLIFFRQRCPEIYKGPIQLDLFIPREYRYAFKVLVTNKPVGAKKALVFHHGRGNQEGYFAELKSQCQMDYIPVRRLYGNQLYLMAGVLAHNAGTVEIRDDSQISRNVGPPKSGVPFGFLNNSLPEKTVCCKEPGDSPNPKRN